MIRLQAIRSSRVEKSDGKNAYWCVVSGSDLWLVDGLIPHDSAEQWDLPQEKAILVDRYLNSLSTG